MISEGLSTPRILKPPGWNRTYCWLDVVWSNLQNLASLVYTPITLSYLLGNLQNLASFAFNFSGNLAHRTFDVYSTKIKFLLM
jgi:hypothetical protein